MGTGISPARLVRVGWSAPGAAMSDVPWRHGREGEVLHATLIAPGDPPPDVVSEAFVSAAELVAGWIGVPVDWSTRATRWEWEQFEEATPHPGVDTGLLRVRPGKERHTLAVASWRPPPERGDETLYEVADVAVHRLPTFLWGRATGAWTVLSLSVDRRVMYGSGEDMPWFTRTLRPWLREATVRLGAVSGKATFGGEWARYADSTFAFAASRHPEVRLVDSDPGTTLWDFGWSTLLTSAHLAKLGGSEGIAALPGAVVEPVDGDRVWLTLGDDPAAALADDEGMWRLFRQLLPALPEGAADIGWGTRRPQLPTVPDAAGLQVRWEADAEQARADGRGEGWYGPTGLTLDAGVLDVLAPFIEWPVTLTDLVHFDRLGAEGAGRLLERLPDAVLDVEGDRPVLRAALGGAVAHPGVVTLLGYAVGPVRVDEGVTVDGAHVRGDPVLDALGPGDRTAARRRLRELGLVTRAQPEVLGLSGDQGSGEWFVWWD